jgi:phage terminase small subunit
MAKPKNKMTKRKVNRATGISDKYRLLVDAYFLHMCDQKKAAAAVGYKQPEKYIFRLFRHPAVAEEIRKRQEKLKENNDITVERTVKEIARIAYANPGEIFEALKDAGYSLSALSVEQKAVLTEFVEDIFEGEKGHTIKRKVKAADKLRALDMLMRYHGAYNDKLKVEGADSLEDKLRAGRARLGQK